MTARGIRALLADALLWAIALSTGERLFYLCAILIGLLFLFALLSLIPAVVTLRVSQQLSGDRVSRGEELSLITQLRFHGLLPVGTLTLCWRFADERGILEQEAPRAFRDIRLNVPLRAAHVGAFSCRTEKIRITDLFGLLRFSCRGGESRTVLSLPLPFDIEKPGILSGEEGRSALDRAQEDPTSPEDTRLWREGDPMKRVHWKLSSRRHELTVRQYETPAPPDTLILLDCSRPVGGEAVPDGEARLRDALCETAVAAAAIQMADQSPVRMPLYGSGVTEFASDNAFGLPQLQEMLALQSFSAEADPASALMLELRRMRRTGAVIVITTRLDAAIADALISIRRSGPSVRLYLCGFSPDRPETEPFVLRLQHHLTEVCYVTPV